MGIWDLQLQHQPTGEVQSWVGGRASVWPRPAGPPRHASVPLLVFRPPASHSLCSAPAPAPVPVTVPVPVGSQCAHEHARVYAYVRACVCACVCPSCALCSVRRRVVDPSGPRSLRLQLHLQARRTHSQVSMLESAGMSVKDGRGQASGGDRRGGKGQILRGALGYAVRACGRSGKQ